jgi:hypothetical protein
MLRLAMAAAYSSEPWHELFVGVAGAAAALTGLLFVSLSINLQHILGQVWLPRRAALTLVLLFETLVIAIVGLVPGQSPTTLGVNCSAWVWRCGCSPPDWLLPAIVLLLGVGVTYAWVLLVEILR